MTARLPYQDPELSTEARVQDLMGRMTLEQEVGQMVQADGRKNAEEQVRQCRAGSFLHIWGEQTIELQKLAEQTGLGIPIVFGIDAIHGHGFWRGATIFPTQLALSCSWDPELCHVMGRITAKEMSCTGLHWTFSPVLCLTRDLRWGRVGETFGEDPYLLGVLGAALVKGYQGQRLSDPDSVLACAKHFAGYSQTVGGRDASEAELSRRNSRSYFLPPFRDMVRAGCRTFMTGYQAIDGIPCVANRWLLTQVLREEWGFEGFVVTDWNNVGRAHLEQKVYPSIAAAVPDAVHAGNDMIMVTPDFYGAAIEHTKEGRIDRAEIQQACRRVLSAKFDLGLFDHKRYPEFDRVPEIVGCAEHQRPLLKAALESCVLLKNGHAGQAPTLPVQPDVRRIAVLGPNADDPVTQLGDWSFGSGQAGLQTGGHPRERISTVLDGVKQRAEAAGIEVSYARGADVLDEDEGGVPEAKALAQDADLAVVVVGDVLAQVGEECDRSELELTGGQMALLGAVKETGTPLVVVLINSKPLCIPWVADQADAILEAFNPGMRGGEAIAQLLFGDENPSGKLTVSFARSLGEQPVYYQQLPGWHGSKYENYDPSPLFAFGYGLSYSHFEYGEPRLNTKTLSRGQSLNVEVDVKNTSDRDGTEIVQLYLNDLYSSCTTPEKVLKGYQRVRIGAKTSKTLTFTLNYDALAFIGADEQPVVEPGAFDVLVGASSRDADLKAARFEVVG